MNQFFGIFFTLHDGFIRTKDNLSLDPLGDLSNQTIATAKLGWDGCDNCNVSCFEFDRIGDVFWDNFRNLVFQFFKCKAHGVHRLPVLAQQIVHRPRLGLQR